MDWGSSSDWKLKKNKQRNCRNTTGDEPKRQPHPGSPSGVSRHFAPAILHESMSLHMIAITELMREHRFLKIRQFRSCQICQSRMSMDCTLRLSVATTCEMINWTWSMYLVPLSQVTGFRAWQHGHDAVLCQISLDIGHSQQRHDEDLRWRMHRGQKYPFSHPLGCSWSLHHNLSCSSNQTIFLALPGAHARQNSCLKFVLIDPWNYRS